MTAATLRAAMPAAVSKGSGWSTTVWPLQAPWRAAPGCHSLCRRPRRPTHHCPLDCTFRLSARPRHRHLRLRRLRRLSTVADPAVVVMATSTPPCESSTLICPVRRLLRISFRRLTTDFAGMFPANGMAAVGMLSTTICPGPRKRTIDLFSAAGKLRHRSVPHSVRCLRKSFVTIHMSKPTSPNPCALQRTRSAAPAVWPRSELS